MTEIPTTATDASDAELISRVRAGDIDSYGLLFDRHRDAALRLARQLTSSAEAEDLVSEAFAKMLPIIQGGGGPDVAFRAYLLTSVRRVHIDRVRAGRHTQPTADLEPFDPGTPFEDPAVDDFERTATAKAFASLPERWQLVLWHTEVEGDKPADVAPLLGMTANSVAALAYRAREGLRQAYLRSHLADTADDSCRWVTEHLGGFVRGGLSRRDHGRVEEHLDDCRKCTAVYLELVEVNSNLRILIAPLLLGASTAGYLTAAGHTGLAASGPWWLRGRRALRGHQGAAAAAVAAVAITAVAATAVIGTRGSDDSLNSGPPAGSQLSDDGGGGAPLASETSGPPETKQNERKPERKQDTSVADQPADDQESPDGDTTPPRDTDGNDPGTDEPKDTETTSPSETTPSESDPTSDPTTEPTTTDPTSDPTSDPTTTPSADLSIGPKASRWLHLSLFGDEPYHVTFPVDGVDQVSSAVVTVTAEDLVRWEVDDGSGYGAWTCDRTGGRELTCTLSVDAASDPQDLALDLYTRGARSEVTATISANGYRDPDTSNNTATTSVPL